MPSNRLNWLAGCLAWMGVVTTALIPVRGDDGSTTTPAPRSEITSVRAVAGNLVVTVRVPAGRRRVTLETRDHVHRGAWTPRKVEIVDAKDTATQQFSIPLGSATETVRVREETESELGLPLGFFSGTNSYAPQVQSGSVGTSAPILTGTTPTTPGTSAADFKTTGIVGNTSTSVVESDIWKIDDHTLYFFNQQRGLQVIDITNPDRRTLTGTLPIAVWGEEMYQLASGTDGSKWLALLTQQDCNGSASEVLIVQVTGGKPTLRGRLPVAGQIRESRLISNTLVIASAEWFSPAPVEIRDANGVVTGVQYGNWQAQTVLTSFDLSKPEKPVSLEPVSYSVNPNAVMATDQYLFVAGTGTRKPSPTERPAAWAVEGNHSVMSFDLTQPSRGPVQSGFVITAGTVSDKFRMGFDGTVLTTVSQTDSGSYSEVVDPKTGITNTVWNPLSPNAVLETFSFSTPLAPSALGKLTLVTNESVYAARISGDRAYVVTFRQIDPLWIVDLANPASPAVRGHLSIPGYSTFLQPMADDTRLLALGSDGSRTRLQLFDVSNTAKPVLQSEITLGTGWSWTEASSNEKAFSVFPESGLALLPWQGQRTTNGVSAWFQGTQLIDFDLAKGTLKARGTIESLTTARRATLFENRVLSLSGSELTTVDPTDRDLPRVVDRLSLTETVDRVLVSGDSLLLIDAGLNPYPQIRLTRASDPEKAVASLKLDPIPLTGATLKGDILHLFQAASDTWETITRTVTKSDITKVFQPPVKQLVTNTVTEVIPPPIVLIAGTQTFVREESIAGIGVTSLTTNEIVVVDKVPQPLSRNWVTTNWTTIFPPFPGSSQIRSVTTTWTHPVYVSQPDIVTTREVVDVVLVPQPVVYVTNRYDQLITENIPVPGKLQVSTVRVGTNSLTPLASLPIPTGTNANYYWAPMKAIWLSDSKMVWTERNEGGFSYGGPIYAVDFAVKTTGLIAPRMVSALLPFWYYQSPHFFAIDVADPAKPALLSQLMLQNTPVDNEWISGSSASHFADGKVFLSHQSSRYTPPISKVIVVTNALGKLEKQIVTDGGTSEIRHFLDVVDFSDATAPVVRKPVNISGALAGVSHEGQLVYTRALPVGDSKDPNVYLQAGAYDGLAVSLVGSMPIPDGWSQNLWIQPNGTVWLGRSATTTTNASALETWALNPTGKFDYLGSTPVAEPVSELRLVDGLLLATSPSHVLLLDPTLPVNAKPVLSEPKPCSIWYDSTTAAADRTHGLWLPRNSYGLWQIAPTP
jgi:hypothetical protein